MKFGFEHCMIIAAIVAFSIGTAVSESVLTSENSTNGTSQYSIMIANVLQEGTALHVIVANNGTAAQNLTGWQLITDNPVNSTYVFPEFTLNPMSRVTVHTHNNNNTATDLYGSGFMWNGTSDVKLFDSSGMLVDDYIINSTSQNSTSM